MCKYEKSFYCKGSGESHYDISEEYYINTFKNEDYIDICYCENPEIEGVTIDREDILKIAEIIKQENKEDDEMICKTCGKVLVLDKIEPYDNYGSEIFYFCCEDDNCNGKSEIIDYSKVTNSNLINIFECLDNLGWFSGDYESIDKDIKSIEKEIARRKINVCI